MYAMWQILGCALCATLLAAGSLAQYEPNWKSLDKRPLPGWFDDVKFGIMMHWGLYSVPSFTSEWFWADWKQRKWPEDIAFMKKNYRPGFTYQDFAAQFTCELFDADKWASLIQSSGAKYYVLTSKHHEGYTMWPSNYSWNWNSVDTGPNRDLVGELGTAMRKTNIKFGLYYSLFAWFHPLWIKDNEAGMKTNLYQRQVMLPQLQELTNTYKPDLFWADGTAGADNNYWNSTGFVAWLYNESPIKDTVIINDRWAEGADSTFCAHGGYWTCGDHYNPGHLIPHKWENAWPLGGDSSYGFHRDMELKDVTSMEILLEQLVSTVSCGGNFLLNLGPTHDGRIIPIFEERLTQIGAWMKINGEAIYGSKPWISQNDTLLGTRVWYRILLPHGVVMQTVYVTAADPHRFFNPQSKQNTIVYAAVLDWPTGNQILLGVPKATKDTKISMLGYPGLLRFKQTDNGLQIDFSSVEYGTLPSKFAWVLKLEQLASDLRQPI